MQSEEDPGFLNGTVPELKAAAHLFRLLSRLDRSGRCRLREERKRSWNGVRHTQLIDGWAYDSTHGNGFSRIGDASVRSSRVLLYCIMACKKQANFIGRTGPCVGSTFGAVYTADSVGPTEALRQSCTVIGYFNMHCGWQFMLAWAISIASTSL